MVLEIAFCIPAVSLPLDQKLISMLSIPGPANLKRLSWTNRYGGTRKLGGDIAHCQELEQLDLGYLNKDNIADFITFWPPKL